MGANPTWLPLPAPPFVSKQIAAFNKLKGRQPKYDQKPAIDQMPEGFDIQRLDTASAPPSPMKQGIPKPQVLVIFSSARRRERLCPLGIRGQPSAARLLGRVGYFPGTGKVPRARQGELGQRPKTRGANAVGGKAAWAGRAGPGSYQIEQSPPALLGATAPLIQIHFVYQKSSITFCIGIFI